MVTAQDRERRLLLDKCERVAWRLHVEGKFVRAMAAAAAGEPIEWQVWPRTDEQDVADQAATEHGDADYSFDPEPAVRLPGWMQGPYATAAPGDARTTYELLADLERDRAERGPLLRELRGSWAAIGYLAAVLPKAEAEPSPAAAFLGVPVITDYDVPWGHLRFVYSDGTTKDVEVVKGECYERLLAKTHEIEPPEIEFKFTPDPDAFKPQYVCPGCYRKRSYLPGYCLMCEELQNALPPPPININSIITGI